MSVQHATVQDYLSNSPRSSSKPKKQSSASDILTLWALKVVVRSSIVAALYVAGVLAAHSISL